jgi:hypothetical protein
MDLSSAAERLFTQLHHLSWDSGLCHSLATVPICGKMSHYIDDATLTSEYLIDFQTDLEEVKVLLNDGK